MTTTISALRRLRQEDCPEFEASLGYKVSPRPAGAAQQDPVSKTKMRRERMGEKEEEKRSGKRIT